MKTQLSKPAHSKARYTEEYKQEALVGVANAQSASFKNLCESATDVPNAVATALCAVPNQFRGFTSRDAFS
jgi:hypothetical protein